MQPSSADFAVSACCVLGLKPVQEPRPRRALAPQALRLALLSAETSTQEAELLATLVRYVVLNGGWQLWMRGKSTTAINDYHHLSTRIYPDLGCTLIICCTLCQSGKPMQ